MCVFEFLLRYYVIMPPILSPMCVFKFFSRYYVQTNCSHHLSNTVESRPFKISGRRPFLHVCSNTRGNLLSLLHKVSLYQRLKDVKISETFFPLHYSDVTRQKNEKSFPILGMVYRENASAQREMLERTS